MFPEKRCSSEWDLCGNQDLCSHQVEMRSLGGLSSHIWLLPPKKRETACEDEDSLAEWHEATEVRTGVMSYRPRNARDGQPPPESGRGQLSPPQGLQTEPSL